MRKTVLTNENIHRFARIVAGQINHDWEGVTPTAYPVPRGGIPAAYAIARHTPIQIVDDPREAAIYIDDIVDSGSTREKYLSDGPGLKFYALVDKTNLNVYTEQIKNDWIVFPWEATQESSIEPNIVRLLQFIGEDVAREGLRETPTRVAKAWLEWCSGYGQSPKDVLKSFEDGAEGVDEMVAQKDLPFYSHCEHHMAPFFGTVTIAYVPDKKIVGLSKLSRLVDVFSKRLQVQERLTNQIAGALMDELQPKGVGVLVKARHLCMESRGIAKQGQVTITSALRGVLLSKPEARAEFLDLAR